MSIDPVDECTFWYTNEYYNSQANGTNGNWQTRIGSFKFPSCGVAVTLSMVSVAFGSLDVGGTSATTNVQLTRSGTGTLIITSIALGGTNASQFALVAPTSGSPACTFGSSSIIPGNSCSFGVQARPTTDGALSANVALTDNATSSSQTVALMVSSADVAVSGPLAAVTVAAGQPASFTISLTTPGGIPTLSATTFSATGNPAATTITFNPPLIPAGSTSASITMTIATTARSFELPLSPPRYTPKLPLALYVIGYFALGLTALAVKYRWMPPNRLVGAYLLISATLTFVALAGCSGGHSTPTGGGGTSGTPAGTSNITVTATSGSLSRTTTATLTVQ